MADDEDEQDQNLRNNLHKSGGKDSEASESEELREPLLSESSRKLRSMFEKEIRKAIEDILQMEQVFPSANPISPGMLATVARRLAIERLKSGIEQPPIDATSDKQPVFYFSQSDLKEYVAFRKKGLAVKSQDWFDRDAKALWDCTHGEISRDSMTAVRDFVLKRYSSKWSHQKVLGFSQRFLERLSTIRYEPRIKTYSEYLRLPKTVQTRKMTSRVVRREDIVEVLKRIDAAEAEGKITAVKARNYRAYARLAAYTGLRPSTMQRLMVGQFRAALQDEKPALHILPEQEKNRHEHRAPIHPIVLEAIEDVLTYDYQEKDDAEPFFMFNSFEKWLERQRIPLSRVRDLSKAHLWLSDFRKFAEQFGDIISWDITNRKFVLAHGMTGVEWEHYKGLQPEDVYEIYLKAWNGVDLTR
jgi:integrase